MFKKKKIKTGEVVRVVGWNGDDDKRRKTDWVSYIDSEGGKHEMEKGLNFYWDFEELESYDLYDKREHEKVVNNHFCLFFIIQQNNSADCSTNSKIIFVSLE